MDADQAFLLRAVIAGNGHLRQERVRQPPRSYGCAVTLENPLVTDVKALNLQIQAALLKYPKADIYLVAHSLGGVVAYGYLAALTETTGIVTSLSGSGAHLRGVITLDSPLGGISSNNTYFNAAQLYYESSCPGYESVLPTALLNLSTIFGSTSKSTPPDSSAPDPQGAQASILSVLYGDAKKPALLPSNQQVAEDAQVNGTSVLTIGNNNDLLWMPSLCFPQVQDFTSTQWLEDEGNGSQIYGRVFTAGMLQCSINVPLTGANHFCVLMDSSVMQGIQDFLPNGATPTSPIGAPPGSD